MNEKTKQILRLISQMIIAAITALLTALGCSSCGVTTAKIYNPNNGTNTQITITTNNPTSVEVPTNADVKVN